MASSLTETSPQVITFGCRLNSYESEVMRNHARSQGLKNTIIINTCAVTAEAERQARQAIRRLKREHPSATIIVTGCSVQIHPDSYLNMPEVDRVLGNHEKMQRDSFSPTFSERVHLTDIMSIRETANHLITGFENHVRAFIQVQNGCDHRCTFCTIPFGRGNNRSVPLGEIVAQIRTLVENGCQEIVFTGVDLTGYGADLPGTPTLGQMIRRVLKLVPHLARVRLSSIDPVEVDQDLLKLIYSEPRVMPHLHLSLQSGDNMILKRMKRRHLREDAIDFCQKVLKERPDILLGADLIAGFPTETEEMFGNTLKIIEECNLTLLHVFPYSPRRGTPAARMPQVDKKLIKERAQHLRLKGEERFARYLYSCIGQSRSVLIERQGKGHTEHFTPVQFIDLEELKASLGKIVPTTVLGVEKNNLIVKING
jgi:threonylcarbamoyladenosine tRNA methylthiotransferase MtaB